jgi:hypothetical protein
MNSVTITQEQLDRWKAGDPEAAAEILFESGLWRELTAIAPAHKLDETEDAMLIVLGELQRRDHAFTPPEFVTVFRIQAARRRKDLWLEENKRGDEVFSLDAPWISGGGAGAGAGEEEGPSRLDGLASVNRNADPEYIARRELALQQTLKLMAGLYKQLTSTYQRHLRALQDGMAELFVSETEEERVARLFEFINRGRSHQRDLMSRVIESCCGCRDTCDTHNRRLRQIWQAFIGEDGAGRQEFLRLKRLGQAGDR